MDIAFFNCSSLFDASSAILSIMLNVVGVKVIISTVLSVSTFHKQTILKIKGCAVNPKNVTCLLITARVVIGILQIEQFPTRIVVTDNRNSIVPVDLSVPNQF
jgi:hypothetical protein